MVSFLVVGLCFPGGGAVFGDVFMKLVFAIYFVEFGVAYLA